MCRGGVILSDARKRIILRKRPTVWKTRLLQYEIRQVGKWKRYNEDWCRHRRVFTHITILFTDSSHAKITLLCVSLEIFQTYRTEWQNEWSM